MEKRCQNTGIETYSQIPMLLSAARSSIRSDLRAWVIAGGQPHESLPNGIPVWAQAMVWQDEAAVDEALALGSPLNARDDHGRGWLWWGIETNMSAGMILNHFRKLDSSWWHADHQQNTPFHQPRLNVAIAHAMACRWWADGLSWQQLAPYGDPIDHARRNGRWDLVSAWNSSFSSLPWFTRP